MKQILTSITHYLVVLLLLCFTLPVQAQKLLDPKTQPRFVNPLPVPSVINGLNGGTFTISVSQFFEDLGLRNPTNGVPMLTPVWGYNGSYPGPTVLAKKDVPLHFFWNNNLYNSSTLQPLPHLLPIDTTIEWALSGDLNWRQDGVPVVTHLHGGHTESASDGGPLSWYTPFFAKKGSDFIKGQNVPFTYDNDQDAATLWYHDHAMGITRLNVYAGLAGFYVLTDDNEQQLKAQNKLPADEYDMGLVIQDRMFTDDGKLFYPSDIEEQGQISPSIIPEFFGDFILVNGKAWPVLQVEPRQYRFRILNGSDSRFYNLFLSGDNTFTQIGSDQGLLPSPVHVSQMLMGPAERRDVIIDFSNPSLWGQTIVLRNNAKTPYHVGRPAEPGTAGEIMAFRVNKPLNLNIPLTVLPATLLPSSITPLVQNGPVRRLLLAEGEDKFERIEPVLGTVDGGAMDFDEPVTENIKLNDTEVWEFYNTTVDDHPIHLHLVKFQVISHQKFRGDVDPVTKKLTNIRLIGQPHLYNLDENGWKDTHIVPAGEVTRVIAKFDRLGTYVWHCHILSHEDHDMMRPFIVTETGNNVSRLKETAVGKTETEDQLKIKVIPNPFSSKLEIQFNLPEAQKVNINVYDSKGTLVKQVYSGSRSAGLQNFMIDGSNMTNGTYFCEIIINNVKFLRKLVLQK